MRDQDPPRSEVRIESSAGPWGVSSDAALDPSGVDWTRVHRTAYLLHQRFQYEYSRPITRLRHRLVITPPVVHGDQRLVHWRIQISPGRGVIHSDRTDAFGNTILDVRVRRVQRSICFDARLVVERHGPGGPYRESAETLGNWLFLEDTSLTTPDRALRDVARSLAASGETGAVLAARVNQWVHAHMTYRFGVTGVRTDAATALRLGQGVCQDYAHIMLTLLRLCGIPARYVSGHLLGEGGSHAWVEALVPDPRDPSQATVHAFDPTNGRVAGLQYLTVAVGRDYGDVAPTSGSYSAGGQGSLASKKSVDVVRVDYPA